MKNDLPIGIFDSGVGGLTVMKEITKLLPNEPILYLGDTAHLPYGDKCRAAVVCFSKKCAASLLQKGIKLLVVACNTATALALEEMQRDLSIPVVGVIQPAISQAILYPFRKIAVIATRATVASNIYQQALHKRAPKAELKAIACPLLVPLVEEGLIDHPATRLILHEYLSPLRGEAELVILGCTHYPILKKAIQEYLGESTELIDSAYACAREVQDTLQRFDLFAKRAKRSHAFFCTELVEKFDEIGSSILGEKICSTLLTP